MARSASTVDFDSDASDLVTRAVDLAHPKPVQVRGLIFQYGKRGSEWGPPWYECLAQGPGGEKTMIKESTVYDSFKGWLERLSLQSVADTCAGAEIPDAKDLQEALKAVVLELYKEKYDVTPFGVDLAKRVAQKLAAGTVLIYNHRDYCGMGLVGGEDHFKYVEVWDGGLDEIRSWASEKDFVEWLSSQSDFALSGADPMEQLSVFKQGNQRITRARLQEFVQKTKPNQTKNQKPTKKRK